MLSEVLARQARELSRREFTSQFPDCFVVYGLSAPPRRSGDFKTGNYPAIPRPAPDNPLRTVRVSALTAVQAMQAVQAAMRSDSREQAGVLMVAKSDRNPYSDRISIGRAASCDLVLPVLLVSKLHAHFLRPISGEPGWEIRDADSTNGTWVNGVLALPGERMRVRPGDTLRLAFCEARFVDADGLFDYFHSLPSPPGGFPGAT